MSFEPSHETVYCQVDKCYGATSQTPYVLWANVSSSDR